MATLYAQGKQYYETSAGIPLVGGKVYTYDAGTTTPRVTYQDAAGTTPNTNPVILDARGEATIFWSGAYKVVLRDALDNIIWTVDNLNTSTLTLADLTRNILAGILSPRTATEIAVGVTPTDYTVPSHDQTGFVMPQRYGWVSSASTAVKSAALAAAGLVAVAAGVSIHLSKWPGSNDATAFDAYGDSITYGVAGTSSTAKAYINLLADRRGWVVTNRAVNGSMVADQADYVYTKTVGNTQQSTMMLGTNDFRFYKEDVYKMLAYQRGHMALAAWLAIPDSNKIKGQSAAAVAAGKLIYTGTWVDNLAIYGGSLGRYSATPGSTVTVGVYGSTVYLGTVIIDGGTSTFEVTIDGVSYGVFQNSCASGNIVSILGRGYMPQVLRFSGLTENTHDVKITVLTIGSQPIYFDWAAGNLGAATQEGPNLWVGNIPRLSNVGYATYGGTDNNTVQRYNELIRDNVSLLAADGLNIQLVDSQSRFDNATMLDPDGIHPNDAGHEAIAQAWQEALNQVAKPGTRVTKVADPVSLAVRNLVTNGNFSINQRNVSGSVVLAANAYGHDMWKAGAAGATYTFAKSGNITTLTISAGSMVQVIAGDLIQQTRHIVSWQGTAKGRQYSIGTYGNGSFLIDLVPGTNAAIEFGVGTLKLVQVEPGSQAHSYQYRSYADELAQSQQWLSVFDAASGEKLGSGLCISATVAKIFIPFDAKMRTKPTGITTAGTFSVLSSAGAAVTVTLTFDAATVDGISVTATAAAGLTAGDGTVLQGLAAGKIIVTGSEL